MPWIRALGWPGMFVKPRGGRKVPQKGVAWRRSDRPPFRGRRAHPELAWGFPASTWYIAGPAGRLRRLHPETIDGLPIARLLHRWHSRLVSRNPPESMRMSGCSTNRKRCPHGGSAPQCRMARPSVHCTDWGRHAHSACRSPGPAGAQCGRADWDGRVERPPADRGDEPAVGSRQHGCHAGLELNEIIVLFERGR
jgi:hypothetical protein